MGEGPRIYIEGSYLDVTSFLPCFSDLLPFSVGPGPFPSQILADISGCSLRKESGAGAAAALDNASPKLPCLRYSGIRGLWSSQPPPSFPGLGQQLVSTPPVLGGSDRNPSADAGRLELVRGGKWIPVHGVPGELSSPAARAGSESGPGRSGPSEARVRQ